MSAAPTLSSVTPNPVTAGAPITLAYSAPPAAPTLVGVTPNPATIGQPITISFAAPGDSTVDLASVIAARLSIAADLRMTQALAAVIQIQSAITAGMGGKAATPTLVGVTPNPATIGQPITLTFDTSAAPLLSATIAAKGGVVADLSVSIPLASVVAAQARIVGGLQKVVTLPATLLASDRESGTVTEVAGALVFENGAFVEYRVDAGAGGSFALLAQLAASIGGELEVLVDGTPIGNWTYRGDPVATFDEEDEEAMPYHIPTETLVTCPAGQVTRLDASIPSNRVEIRLVNTHLTDRLAYARVQVGAAAPTIDVATADLIEADFGRNPLERPDSNVAHYAKPAGTNPITVRVIQFSTL